MYIIRDGKEIELSPAEIIKAWEEHERSIIRYEVETVINDSGFTFDNFSEQGSEYASADDFRSDFIEKCVDECFDSMTDAESSAFFDKVEDIVKSNADDFELEEQF